MSVDAHTPPRSLSAPSIRAFIASKLSLILRLLVCAGVLWSAGSYPGEAAAIDWRSKVDPWVLQNAAQGATEMLIFLDEQADLSGAERLLTKREKGQFVYRQLTETARRSQGALLKTLEEMAVSEQVEYRSYWVANAVWVRAEAAVIQALAKRPEVSRLYANPSVRFEEIQEQVQGASPAQPSGIEWNIAKVRAPEVWAKGYTGQGVVIGGQDTGYDWDHPALKSKYRGWNGSAADHNYNWHDAIHENNEHTASGNPCGFDSPVPCDDGYHGTHTMGTMVGDDGQGNQIGVAPGARWIGCRNMEQGWGKPSTYMECYQWFIAPTDLNNLNPNPAMAPDVINNSWSCPKIEGCNADSLLSTVEAVRAAGILTAHSAGNDGSRCETIDTPAAIYDASFTVGNTDSNDMIAFNSSRGPVTVDKSNRPKPDVSAPGTSVRSSYPSSSEFNNYTTLSGTSMAAPHVAGLVALLLSARPDLKGQVDEIETLIRNSAIPRTSTDSCGVPGSQVPNNTYGWGRVDALNAISLKVTKHASDITYDPGQVITYTLQVSHGYPITATYNLLVTDTIPLSTSFITATLPHTRTGDTVVWEAAQLLPDTTLSLELVVQVSPEASGIIYNSDYSASSDEFGRVNGTPLPIYGGPFFYFPLIFR